MSYTARQIVFGSSAFVGGGSSLSLTLTSTVAGNTLVAFCGGWNGGVSSYTMPAGWVKLENLIKTSNSRAGELYYYPNNPGGITSVAITQDANGAADHCIVEITGVSTTPGDGHGNAQNNGNTAVSISATSTTGGDCCVFGFLTGGTGAGASGASPQDIHALDSDPSSSGNAQWNIFVGTGGSAGAQTGTATISSDDWVGFALNLEAAAVIFNQSITVAGSGAEKLLKQLDRIRLISGTGVVSMATLFGIAITVAGTHALKVLKRLNRIRLVAGTGTAHVMKGYQIALTIAGNAVVTLYGTLTAGVVRVFVARIIQKAISVTGTHALSFSKATGNPALAHPTRYNISSTPGTTFTITTGP